MDRIHPAEGAAPRRCDLQRGDRCLPANAGLNVGAIRSVDHDNGWLMYSVDCLVQGRPTRPERMAPRFIPPRGAAFYVEQQCAVLAFNRGRRPIPRRGARKTGTGRLCA